MSDDAVPPPLPPPRIAIKYSLTRWDVLRWQLWATLRNRIVLGFWFVATLFLVIQELRTPEVATHSIGFKIGFVLIFAGVWFIIMYALQLIVLVCMLLARKGRGLLGEHELEIREDGLMERTDVNESLARWAGFSKVASSGRYFYIYVTDTMVHVVPKRCFASEQEAQLFRNEIERRIPSR